MFSFVMILVPAHATLSVMTAQNGRKMLVVKEFGLRLWGEPAVELARLHKAGQDAVLTGYLRPRQGDNGPFPTVAITSVRPADGRVDPSEDLEHLLDRTPSKPAEASSPLAEQLP